MKKIFLIASLLMVSLSFSFAAKKSLEQATVTKVKNEVLVANQNEQKSASVNDVVNMGMKVETKTNSLAELKFADQSVTRLGSNTIFSFDSKNRELKLDKGTLLLHTPPGNGGATIRTAAVTAAITGTTILISATPNGGFMMLMLESKHTGGVDFNGHITKLKPSQLVVINPGQKGQPQVYEVDLAKVLSSSGLFNGFEGNFVSTPEIKEQIAKQLDRINDGKVDPLGVTLLGINEIGDFVAVDSTVLQALIENNIQSANPFGDNSDLGLLGQYYNGSYSDLPDQNFNSGASSIAPLLQEDGTKLIAANKWTLPTAISDHIDLAGANDWIFFGASGWTDNGGGMNSTFYFDNTTADSDIYIIAGAEGFSITSSGVTTFAGGPGNSSHKISSLNLLSTGPVTLNNVIIQAADSGQKADLLSIYGSQVDIYKNSYIDFNSVLISSSTTLNMQSPSTGQFFSGVNSGLLYAGTDMNLSTTTATGAQFLLPTQFSAVAGNNLKMTSAGSASGFTSTALNSVIALSAQTVTFDNAKFGFSNTGTSFNVSTGLGQVNTGSYGSIEYGKVNFVGTNTFGFAGGNSFTVYDSSTLNSAISNNKIRVIENGATAGTDVVNVYKQ